MIPSTYKLANFAPLLLSMSVNQAGLERSFSDLKIKKTWLQNHLKLPRLEKMAKVRIPELKLTALILILFGLHRHSGLTERCRIYQRMW